MASTNRLRGAGRDVVNLPGVVFKIQDIVAVRGSIQTVGQGIDHRVSVFQPVVAEEFQRGPFRVVLQKVRVKTQEITFIADVGTFSQLLVSPNG